MRSAARFLILFLAIFMLFSTRAQTNTLPENRVEAPNPLALSGSTALRTAQSMNTPFASPTAMLNGDEWDDLGGGVTGFDAVVKAMVEYNGFLYVGGVFDAAGGEAARNIARFNLTTSQWEAMGTGTDNAAASMVNDIVVHNGLIYVGGYFTQMNGQNLPYLAVYNPSNGQWSSIGSLDVSEFTNVFALHVFGDDLYVGGEFQEINGLEVSHLARYNITGETWHRVGTYTPSDPFDVPFMDGTVMSIDGNDTDLVFAGFFTSAGDETVNGVVRYSPVTETWTPLGEGMGEFGFPSDVAFGEGVIYVSGDFDFDFGITQLGAYSIGDNEWTSIGDVFNNSVIKLLYHNGGLFVGGDFTEVNSVVSGGVARYDVEMESWETFGTGLTSFGGMFSGVVALGIAEGKFIAGGIVDNAGGVAINSIARWSADFGGDENGDGGDGGDGGGGGGGPVTFLPIAPGNGELGVSIKPLFTWNDPGVDVDNYVITIYNNENLTGIHSFTFPEITGTSYQYGDEDNFDTDLEPNFTYYWEVVGFDESNQIVAQSEVFSFTTAVLELAKPSLIAPGPDANDISLTPTFTWSKDELAEAYTLEYSEGDVLSGTPTVVELEIADLTDNNPDLSYSYTLPAGSALDAGTQYTWRVTATADGLDPKSSDPSSFTTTPPLGAFSLLTPINEAADVTLTPTLTWQRSDNANFYGVTLFKSDDLDNQIHSANNIVDVEGVSYTVPEGVLEHDTEYTWIVFAANNGGFGPNTAPNFTFTTIKRSVALDSPDDESGFASLDEVEEQTFTWIVDGGDASASSVFLITDRDLSIEGNLLSAKGVYFHNSGDNVSSHEIPDVEQKLVDGFTYYWQVSTTFTKDSEDLGQAQSESWSFMIAPEMPELNAPVVGATLTASTPFSWTAEERFLHLSGANNGKFQVQLLYENDENADPATNSEDGFHFLVDGTNDLLESITLEDLVNSNDDVSLDDILGLAGQTYFWRVRIHPEYVELNQDRVTLWSVLSSVEVPGPKAITLTGPQNVTANQVSGNFTLTVVDGDGNSIEVSEDTQFSLTSTSGGTVTFNPVSPVTVLAGANSVMFTYSDTQIGNKQVTATWFSGDSNLDGTVMATHQITVNEPNPFASGDGSSDNPYVITDVVMLQAMKDYLSSHFVLGADIDASETAESNNGRGFMPIGSFSGSLDGKEYQITGLTIDDPRTDGPFSQGIGLFTSLAGTLSNVRLEQVYIRGRNYVSGLAARVQSGGAIINSYVSGTVSGNQYIGGLVAQNVGGSITNSYTSGTITGTDYVGGLVGFNTTSSITNSYAIGTVSGSSNVGGLVGLNSISTITNTYASGTVSGSSIGFVGGLVGGNAGGTITNSFWDTQTSVQRISDGGNRKSTADMKKQSTFSNVNWDFDDVWQIIEGVSYPYLRNNAQNPPPGVTPFELPVLNPPVEAAQTTFSWSGDATMSYILEIDDDKDKLQSVLPGETARTDIIHHGISSGNSWDLSPGLFEDGKTYFWRVSVPEFLGSSIYLTSEVGEFTPKPTPDVISVTYPGANGTNIPTSGITFTWEGDAHATKYQILVYETSNTETPVIDAMFTPTENGTLAYTMADNPVLKPGTDYSWRVIGYNGTKLGKINDFSKFKTIDGNAPRLAFRTAPSEIVTVNTYFPIQPSIVFLHANGNTVTTQTGTVTVSTSGANGTLIGTTTTTAVAGVATFSNLRISPTGTYELTFSAPGYTPVTHQVTVQAAATGAAKLVVKNLPSVTTSGAVFSPQPQVQIQDNSGNVFTTGSFSSLPVTVTVSSGASIVGTQTVHAIGGVATFTNLGITSPPGIPRGAFTLTFSAISASSANQSITITPPPPRLTVTSISNYVTSGSSFSNQPRIAIYNSEDRLATTATATVTVTMSGGSGATLSPTTATSVVATSGVASFSGLGITGPSGTYKLTFSATGFTPVSKEVSVLSSSTIVYSTTFQSVNDDNLKADIYKAICTALGANSVGCDRIKITSIDPGKSISPYEESEIANTNDGLIPIFWEAPRDEFFELFPITHYPIEFREKGTENWTVFARPESVDTVAVLTGLKLDTTYEVRTAFYTEKGISDFSEPIEIETMSLQSIIDIIDEFAELISTSIEMEEIPKEVNLSQNYPNPFNPTTSIRYSLPEFAEVTLEVYNTLGQRMAVLVQSQQPAGWHTVQLDASRWSSGTYIYRLRAGDHVITKKLLLIK
jgi:hypothetical protein